MTARRRSRGRWISRHSRRLATVNDQAVEVWTLGDTRSAGERDVTNSFGEPERIAPRRSTFKTSSARFDYGFPPLSLTVLKWNVRPS